ncbi:MAG: hypothetical protein ACEY3F_01175, partial [Wolbachia sp.]
MIFGTCANKFPELNYVKVKKGVFIGPQIRKIIADSHFQNLLDGTERDAWVAFKIVVTNVLEYYKSGDYVNYKQKC